MTENVENRDTKRFVITRGLLARLVPVVLFIGLGSFAVVQSILGDKSTPEKTEAEADAAADSGDSKAPLLANVEQAQQARSNTPATLQENNSTTKNDLATQPSSPNSFSFGDTAKQTNKPDSATSQQTQDTFGSNLNSQATRINAFPAAKSFSTNETSRNPNSAAGGSAPAKSADDLLKAAKESLANKATDPARGSISLDQGQTAPQENPKQQSIASNSNRGQNNAPTNSVLNNANDSTQNSAPNSNNPSTNPQTSPSRPANFALSDEPTKQPEQPNPIQIAPQKSFNPASSPGPLANSNPIANQSNSAIPKNNGSDVRPINRSNGPESEQTEPRPYANPQSPFSQSSPQSGTTNQSTANNPQSGHKRQPNQNSSFANSDDSPNNSGGGVPISSAPQSSNSISRPNQSSQYPSNLNQQGNLNDTSIPTQRDPGIRGTDNDVSARQTAATPGESELEGAQIPSLSIEKIAPREIQVDQPAEFKLLVRNVGRVPAHEVRVFDQIPNGARYVSSMPEATRGTGNSNLTWNLGTIKPGEDRTIQLVLQPTEPGEIGSVAQVTFATPASMRTLVTQPQLQIEHSGPEKSLIGDRVNLEINVKNNGNGAAKDVMIQENVPPQLKFSDEFRELEYEIGTLAPGQSRKVTLTLAAVEVGRFRNVVFATGGGGLSAQHAIDMEVTAPHLEVTSDGPNRRFLKRNAEYTFSVRNSGTAIATNIDLIAKLSPGIKFLSANNEGQYDSGSHAVYWSLARLNIGQSENVVLTATPMETGPQDFEIIATADLNQKTSVKQPLQVEHLVDVFFEIDDLEDHIEIGSETKYRIRIVNQGTTPATNVRLTLSCDPGIRPQATDNKLPGEIRGQEVLFAPIASLNAGEEFTAVVTATGISPGDHRVVANLHSDSREIISKEESTQVYADR